jgi:serine/threonine-protein kinase
MTSELVEGASLEQRIGSGALPVEQAAKYFEQALSALSYAHREGVVHRDIKPGHLIITPDDSVKITGFGLAKKATDPQLTQPGIVMGSVHYMSPEQVKGSTELDRRSDIYSLGVVLYEAVTGQKPFDSKSQFEVFLAHVNQEPAPPSSVHAGISPALDQIILTAMAKLPASRFQTAEEFRDSLGKLHGVLRDPVGEPDAAGREEVSGARCQVSGVEPGAGREEVSGAGCQVSGVEPGAGVEPSLRAYPSEPPKPSGDAWATPYEPPEAASHGQPAAVPFHEQFAPVPPEPFAAAPPEPFAAAPYEPFAAAPAESFAAPFAAAPYEQPPATPHSEPPARAGWHSEQASGEVRPAREPQQGQAGWSYSEDGRADWSYSDDGQADAGSGGNGPARHSSGEPSQSGWESRGVSSPSGADGAAAGSSSSWASPAGGSQEETGSSAAWSTSPDAGWGQAQNEPLDAAAARAAADTWPEAEDGEEPRGVPLLLRPTGATSAHRHSPAARVQPREPEESGGSWFGEQAFAGWTSKDILAVGALTFVIVAAVFFALLTFLNR